MTTRFRAESKTMDKEPRAEGLCVGKTSIQRLPVHSHVSPSSYACFVPESRVVRPPKRTARWMAGSQTILVSKRPEGVAANTPPAVRRKRMQKTKLRFSE